jgi:hypothetical protein
MIEKEKSAGVIYAAWRMVNYEIEKGVIIKCNSRLYDKVRTEVSETHSVTMKGRTPWNKGRKETREEVLDNIQKAALARPEQTSEQRENQAKKTRGQKRSTEWKEEHSKLMAEYYENNERRSKTEEEKEHLSKVLTGVPKPDGMGAKLSATVAKQKAEGTHYSQQKKLIRIKIRKSTLSIFYIFFKQPFAAFGQIINSTVATISQFILRYAK